MANNGMQVSKTDRTRNLTAYLERATDRMNTVLPKHMTPERLARVAITAISQNPRLLECTQESLALALMEAGQLGLEPNGVMGQAYLVPYYNKKIKGYEAQFQPGYRGLIDLARRSGEVAKIEARVVYDGDDFDYEYGLSPKLVHKPSTPDRRGDVVFVYGIAWFTTEGADPMFEVMTHQEVESIRQRSQASDNGPWVSDWEPMARKTVVKRLAKYLPLSPEAEMAYEADSRREAGEVIRMTDAGLVAEDIDEPKPSRTEGLREKLSEEKPQKREPTADDLEKQRQARDKLFMVTITAADPELAGDVDALRAWCDWATGKADRADWTNEDYSKAMAKVQTGEGLEGSAEAEAPKEELFG